jgi:hypothetical protein
MKRPSIGSCYPVPDLTLVASITRADIAAIDAGYGKSHPYGANRFNCVVRKMYNVGGGHDSRRNAQPPEPKSRDFPNTSGAGT